MPDEEGALHDLHLDLRDDHAADSLYDLQLHLRVPHPPCSVHDLHLLAGSADPPDSLLRPPHRLRDAVCDQVVLRAADDSGQEVPLRAEDRLSPGSLRSVLSG